MIFFFAKYQQVLVEDGMWNNLKQVSKQKIYVVTLLEFMFIARAGHIFFKNSGPLILADFPPCKISGQKL
jgi:hypothetical protein